MSTYGYGNNGGDPYWANVGIQDGRPRGVYFRVDLNTQVIRRDEADQNSGGDPHEIWYRFGGKQLAYVGNNNTITTDYVTSVNNRTTAQGTGAYMNGAGSMTLVTDTDQGYDPINSYDSGQVEGGYTVQAGDTLASIAAQLWGDSSLWYKLAEVNGLAGDESLVEGTLLMIPPGVIRSTYTASTFTPYDPNDVIGNTAPTAVKPPKSHNNCGGFFILAVIAIAVTTIVMPGLVGGFSSMLNGGGFFAGFGAGMSAGTLAGAASAGAAIGMAATGATAATGLTTALIAGGAAAGAAGSIVSQGVGIGTGIQDKFSWNAVENDGGGELEADIWCVES